MNTSNAPQAPRVTVLMAVYNGEWYVREAVAGILAQTLGDFEFLIIDDGSTDSSAEIIAQFQDPRIRLVSNKENIGLTASLNRGLEMARAELVARQDADDISLPDRLAKQVRYLEEHPQVAVAGTQVELVDEAGAVLMGHNNPCSHAGVIWGLLFHTTLYHPTVMMRKAAVAQGGGYDEKYITAQDYDLWCRMAQTARFANLPDVLVRYRIHPGSVSARRAAAQEANACRALSHFSQWILGRALSEDHLRLLRSLHRPGAELSEAQVREAMGLLLELCSALAGVGSFSEEEIRELRQAMIEDLIRAAHCSPDYVKRSDLRGAYWRSVLPDVLWRAGWALCHPAKAWASHRGGA